MNFFSILRQPLNDEFETSGNGEYDAVEVGS